MYVIMCKMCQKYVPVPYGTDEPIKSNKDTVDTFLLLHEHKAQSPLHMRIAKKEFMPNEYQLQS